MSHPGRTWLVRAGALAAVAALAVVACEARAEEARAGGGATAPLPEPLLASLRAALEPYEAVRAELAVDRLDGTPSGASRLARALRRASDGSAGVTGDVPDAIAEATRAAESLADAANIAAARAFFGDVSRLLLQLARADPRLVEGRHVFVCPMTESFGEWIQPTEALRNPYMGAAMPRCGSSVDVAAVPTRAVERAREPAPPAESRSTPAPAWEPEFRPGIPGVTMADVRDFKFLWREIEELQVWERGERITVSEFRSKVIEKTAHFLELDRPAQDAFAAAASDSVTAIRDAFSRRRGAGDGREQGFSSATLRPEIRAAVSRVTSLLGTRPRSALFRPGCKKWLLKLAFGPREAKEAREARADGEAGSVAAPR